MKRNVIDMHAYMNDVCTVWNHNETKLKKKKKNDNEKINRRGKGNDSNNNNTTITTTTKFRAYRANSKWMLQISLKVILKSRIFSV